MASPTSDKAVLTVADGCLVLSHRLSEWIARAPTMEEDIALGNVALDLLGQARGLYQVIGAADGRSEDQLAYFREAQDWRNPLICELPDTDFGFAVLRLLFVSAWLRDVWSDWLADIEVPADVRGVAEKALKENAYHLRHAASWVVRLGDGTEESHARMRTALDVLWPYRGELATPAWYEQVEPVLTEATLPPAGREVWTHRSSRDGWHTEHLGHLLAEMQSLARAHPQAAW
jgi:ring-1,2-phenylacetyl-CoA epoxidase subunit PaaC